MADPYCERAPEAPRVPLVVSIPHCGTMVPPTIAERFTDAGHLLADTDWHVHELYDFVPQLGAHTLFAKYSRYVVDLNRPPDGHSLYPGRAETTVVPTSTFSGDPIYKGPGPDQAETIRRIEAFHTPYHRRLQALVSETRDRFGFCILLDAHSITSLVPRFFDGPLPGLILGDAEGTSAGAGYIETALQALSSSPHTVAHNHPFKGGFITRHYGDPKMGVHALQLEMSQRLYMDESPPFRLLPNQAMTLRSTLQRFLEALL